MIFQYLLAGLAAFVLWLTAHNLVKWTMWKDKMLSKSYFRHPWRPIKTVAVLGYLLGCLVLGPVALVIGIVFTFVALIMLACMVLENRSAIFDGVDGWWNRPFFSWFK